MFYIYDEDGQIIKIEDSKLLAQIGSYKYENWQTYNDERVKDGYFPIPYEEYVINRNANSKVQTLEDLTKSEIIEREKQYRRSEEEFKLFVREGFGSFYFYNYENIKNNVERQYLMRFIRLCDKMDYHNKVKLKKGTYALESDLGEVLILSKNETIRTKKALIKANLITIEEDKSITINKKYAQKGEIKSKKFLRESVRMFPNGVDRLYESVNPKSHKNIALLFELLPYCNIHHNILCNKKCTKERDIENIKPLTMEDITKITNTYEGNPNKLKRALLDMKVGEEDAIIIVLRGKKHFIYVNPHIYVRTSNMNDLISLANMFKVDK